MRTEGREGIEGTRILSDSSKGRLLRFLFCPPALGPFPVVAPLSPGAEAVSARPPYPSLGGFAERLARVPVDLVTRLGMERSNAYYAAGCPVELCDHAAARDLWGVIYKDAIAGAERRDGKNGTNGTDNQ
jgi:hypothetical protein